MLPAIKNSAVNFGNDFGDDFGDTFSAPYSAPISAPIPISKKTKFQFAATKFSGTVSAVVEPSEKRYL